VHALPSLHAVPSLTADQPVVDVAGAHAWQAFAGSIVPGDTRTPPMKHWTPQLPPPQTSPGPHGVPSPSVGWVQVPAPSQASPWHGLPSLGHVAPLGFSTMAQPPLPSHVELTWQLVGEQLYGVPTQLPALHASPDVHALPSLHAVPSGALDQVLVDVDGTQAWHGFAGLMVPVATRTPPMKHPGPQLPPVHTSPPPHIVPSGSTGCVQVPVPLQVSDVHGLPSSGQGAPLAASTMVQPPLPSHVEEISQLVGAHVYGVPAQVPAVHTSFDVHALPSLQLVPSLRFVQPVVEVDGTQAWHAFDGSMVPDATTTPPMKHSAPQLPA
jgi:hypothetical protein